MFDKFHELLTKIEFDKLTGNQILWFKYADKIGLNVNWLFERIYNFKTNDIYELIGLAWENNWIKINENLCNKLNNSLLIELKYIGNLNTVGKPQINTNNSENNFDVDFNGLLCNNSNYISYTSLGSIGSISSSISDNAFTIINKFDELIESKSKNPDILNNPDHYISLNDFIKKFKFIDETIEMPNDLPKIKFEITVVSE
jgi:hypothetical protein